MKISSAKITLVLSLLVISVLLVACNVAESTEQIAILVPENTLTTVPPAQTEISITPTNPPDETIESSPPESSIDQVIAGLEGLPIDEFFDESYKQLLLREPEVLTYAHLSQEFGLRDDQLNDLADAYIRQTQQLEVAILDLLRTHDREQLTPDQQLSYDIYEWDLDNRVRGHRFMYNDYPLTHFIFSYDFALNELFTELHELNTRENAEDYISRLSQVNRQVDQLLEGLILREEAGVVPPDFIISMALNNLHDYLGMRSNNPDTIEPRQLPVFSVFNESLDPLSSITPEEKMELRDFALQEIETSFIPAYLKLIDYLEHQETIATSDAGVWKFPNGEEYYAYKLRDETSTDLTPEEVHQIGLAEVDRIKAEMRQVFNDLGYPAEESFGNSLGRAIKEGGSYNISSQAGKDEYIAAVEAIIEEADQRMDELFDIGPSWGVEVVGGPMGGYYTPGTPDGSRPGAYHVGILGSGRNKFLEPTIAYHEAVPGHHYQIATGQALDLPMFRKEGGYNGFVEGWALYAERLAWEMGLYEDDPYGNVGRLQMELLRAVRLVTDTGIHSKGWTRQEAQSYMDQAMGAPGYFSHEVDRYVVIPAQATGYKIGMLKILELRQRAMDALGDQFAIKEFHNIVIGNGSLPLEILERLVDDYIAAAQNQ
jgi:uncharacterized protein (DUF885 family)